MEKGRTTVLYLDQILQVEKEEAVKGKVGNLEILCLTLVILPVPVTLVAKVKEKVVHQKAVIPPLVAKGTAKEKVAPK